ncbi:TRM11 family SAM-dependent methyltransferase [Halomicrobium salinisoli]|uniref:TRM11 family SAM-dependent methyltransferase n=1 Tax=Halomicrobium salinisoli TaxID=2878391 RepID=UPI001CF06FC5|nr:DNA methyltransferase [Halomicrobium salinisoli]
MRTAISLTYERPDALPAPFTDDDVRTPPVLVERCLAEHTDPGDVVLDPFAGFGTTLRVATAMDRRAYGVELEERRVAYIREQGGHGTVIHGDARDLAALDLPAVDCVYTSPPFMVEGMPADPLQNYDGDTDYADYLDDVRDVFARVRELLRPGGHVLVDVSNMKYDEQVTTLAWDLADAIRRELHFEGEVVVSWEPGDDVNEYAEAQEGTFGYGYDHSYVLVFGAPE